MEKNVKLTPWFDAKKHKPVRVGMYEFYDSLRKKTVRARWGGEYWTWDGGWRWSTWVGDKWRGVMK